MVVARFHLKVASGLRIVELSQTYLFLSPPPPPPPKKKIKIKMLRMFLFEVALLVDLYKTILSFYDVGKVPLESGFWAMHCGTQPNLPISLSKKKYNIKNIQKKNNARKKT